MIPTEIAEIAKLIWPECMESEDERACEDVIKAAWRIYDAGYRLSQPAPALSNGDR